MIRHIDQQIAERQAQKERDALLKIQKHKKPRITKVPRSLSRFKIDPEIKEYLDRRRPT